MTDQEKLKILFLCTGNSCRSQMAQGWANALKDESLLAFSAGVSPTKVNETAIKVMADAGVDISEHTSKHVDELMGLDFDYVVTVCDNAKERCPIFTGKAKLIHRSFDDPIEMFGTPDEIIAEFRRIRDEIRTFVESMPESLEEM